MPKFFRRLFTQFLSSVLRIQWFFIKLCQVSLLTGKSNFALCIWQFFKLIHLVKVQARQAHQMVFVWDESPLHAHRFFKGRYYLKESVLEISVFLITVISPSHFMAPSKSSCFTEAKWKKTSVMLLDCSRSLETCTLKPWKLKENFQFFWRHNG